MSKSVMELSPVEAVACCAPLGKGALTMEDAESIAPLLKALAEPVRLRLLSLVAPTTTGRRACATSTSQLPWFIGVQQS